jgi:TPR repeat protein
MRSRRQGMTASKERAARQKKSGETDLQMFSTANSLNLHDRIHLAFARHPTDMGTDWKLPVRRPTVPREPAPEPPTPRRRRRWLAVLIAAALGVGATAALFSEARVDPARELASVEHTSAQGNHDSQMMLGLMYREGRDGLKVDKSKALYWLQQAAEGGQTYAADLLGRMYADGEGMPRDPAMAVSWWTRAAQQGSADAQRRLGVAYLDGFGGAKDSDLARKWLTQAAAQGDRQARTQLEELYREGLAEPQALSVGDGWLTQFASTLHSKAWQTVAAVEDFASRGLSFIQPSGSMLIRKAEQGDAVAEYQLACRYRSGAWGVSQDNAMAMYWFTKAASDGNPLAARSLARIYANGLLGVKPDPKRAAYWRSRNRPVG